MNVKAFMVACVMGLLPVPPATAHHSFAVFDNETVVILAGTVTEFEWVNPHSWIYLTVADESGAARDWSVELGSISASTTAGWTSDTVKPGDAVTIEMNPLRDGARGGHLVTITLPDGAQLTSGGRPNDPSRAAPE
jgi:hypothetical protein